MSWIKFRFYFLFDCIWLHLRLSVVYLVVVCDHQLSIAWCLSVIILGHWCFMPLGKQISILWWYINRWQFCSFFIWWTYLWVLFDFTIFWLVYLDGVWVWVAFIRIWFRSRMRQTICQSFRLLAHFTLRALLGGKSVFCLLEFFVNFFFELEDLLIIILQFVFKHLIFFNLFNSSLVV